MWTGAVVLQVGTEPARRSPGIFVSGTEYLAFPERSDSGFPVARCKVLLLAIYILVGEGAG